MRIQKPGPEFQEADIVRRRKKTDAGYHYGTVVRTEAVMPPNALRGFYPKFLVAHTMPNIGKHPDSIEGFSDGKPVERLRLERTAYERLLVEQEAISDFGRPYLGFDNCETDVNRVHFQNPTSPTANLAAVLLLSGLAIAAFGNRN